jgi:hypothetical protein
MADDQHDQVVIDPHEALRLMDEARNRLRTAIWALHGMHQDMKALTADDIADVEQLLSEILDAALTPAYESLSQIVGTSPDGTVTTH